jgi:ankyrin repeat protein
MASQSMELDAVIVMEDFKHIAHYFKGLTPLFTATIKNELQEVRRLLSTEQNVKAIVDQPTFGWITEEDEHRAEWWQFHGWMETGYYDMNPLTIAAKLGYVEIANLLLKYGANINWVSTETGSTALHLACANNHFDVVKLLMDMQANVNIKDDDERTPLHFARTVDVADMLIKAGAEVNVCSEYGTPLHHIIKYPHDLVDQSSLVKLYLNSNADKCIGDADGESPYDDAVQELLEKIYPLIGYECMKDPSLKQLYDSVLHMSKVIPEKY